MNGVLQTFPRAFLLGLSSLSYVIYILAYVGRDGVVYWSMTLVLVYVIFRKHLEPKIRKKIVACGVFVVLITIIPFALITVSRFFDADQGGGWSFFEYFGAQIQNFSDYSSIDRPLTNGLQNFPIFSNALCSIIWSNCPNWLDAKDSVFDMYLTQGKAPWLFGTFISDLVGDFGVFGGLVFIFVFSLASSKVSSRGAYRGHVSISQLLLVIFLFLTPYWGVFYFRFSIMNGFIVVNLAFILFVWALQRLGGGSHRGV